jgi:nicotinamide riboside transporter PnuC
MEIALLLLFGIFVLWLAARILEKAGFEPQWAFVLLIPVVNVIMIWVFAFADWPKLKKKLPIKEL